MTFNEKYEAIKKRFNGAKFSVSCFDTIDEIENKILNDTDDVIIYRDYYDINQYNSKTKKWKVIRENNDYFIVRRKEGQNAIYYKDVIDCLIENDFKRDDSDHRYMENIKEYHRDKRNDKSIKMYGSFWGS